MNQIATAAAWFDGKPCGNHTNPLPFDSRPNPRNQSLVSSAVAWPRLCNLRKTNRTSALHQTEAKLR
jgi:hypothetical protein